MGKSVREVRGLTLHADALDDYDRDILSLLIQDGRMSYADLGRAVNLSRAAVRERVHALKRAGIIERFTVAIDPKKVGLSISAFFEIDVEPRSLPVVAKTLAVNEHVLSVNQMTGPSTLHVHAALRDSDHLKEFLHATIYSIDGISMVRSYILLRSFKPNQTGLRIS